MRKLLGITLLSLIFLTSCTSTGSNFQDDAVNSKNESTSQSDDTTYNEPDTSWIPDGFNNYDGNVAWRWVERESDCSDCIFWHIQVITNNGCPGGIYASINISRNDEVVDWTNDTIPYLGPGQKAVLAFEKYGLSGSGSSYQGELTELNCR